MVMLLSGLFLLTLVVDYLEGKVTPPVNNSQRVFDLSRISAIINGRNIFSRGFFVKVQDHQSDVYCGGTVIAPSWIITAATCVVQFSGSKLI